MKKLFLLVALLAAPAFALTCPSGFVELAQTGIKNAVTGQDYTGQLTVTRTYNDSSARGDQQTISITGGAIDQCIAGGNYTIRQRGSGSGLTIAPYWTVPSTGGPYAIPDIEGSMPVTPQTSVAVTQVSGSDGVVAISGGHGGVVSGSPTDCVKVDASSGPCGSGGGATIPSVTNLIAGSGTGNGADSGIAANSVVTLSASQSLTNKTVNGVSPTTMGYLDVTSSIQMQLGAKEPAISAGGANTYWRGDKTFQPFPFNASSIATLDADLISGAKLGGGTATDNTTALNSYLAGGSSTVPKYLFLDGPSVDAGILLPAYGNVTIRGCGWRCGFFTKSGSDAFGITNSTSATAPWTPFDPGQYLGVLAAASVPSPTNTGSVILEDFFLNGNRGTRGSTTGVVSGTLSSSFGAGQSEMGYDTLAPPGATQYGAGTLPATATIGDYAGITNGSGKNPINCADNRTGSNKVWCYWTGSVWTSATSGMGGGQWYTGIDLSTLDYVRIRNVRVLNAPTYAVRLGNVSVVDVSDSLFEQDSYGGSFHEDGLHIDGPASNIFVHHNVYQNIDDDANAFNSPEGWGGAISAVQLDGNTYNLVLDAGRFLGNWSKITISHEVGSVTAAGFLLGGTGNIGSVNIADVHLPFGTNNGGAFVSVNESAPLEGTNNANIASLTISNSSTGNPVSTSPFVWVRTSSSGVVQNLTLNNDRYEMTTSQHAASPVLQIDTGSTVTKMTVNGFAVVSPTGQNYTVSLLNMNGGSLGELVLNSVNPTGFSALANSWTSVSRISGTGLIASGFTVPDAKVVNGVPYLSDGSGGGVSGQPFIKLGGSANGTDGTVTPLLTSVGLTTNVTGLLPRANGGLNSATPGTGLLRDGVTPAASELSGDATTSGSNAVTVKGANGVLYSGLTTGLLKNTTTTGVPSIAVAGTDYAAPTTGSSGQFPTVNGSGGWGTSVASTGTGNLMRSTAFAAVATSGSATDLSTGTLPAARLPNPTASTLGGIESIVAATHQWIDSISASGVPHQSQPAFADVSGTATNTQIPTAVRAGGFSVMFRGSDATAGTTLYLTIPYACTITDWVITGDSTATIKLWRVADGGTAVPTVTNTLSTSGFSLATGMRIHSTTLTDLSSTAIAAYDTFGVNLFASASTHVEFTLGCAR